MLCDAEENSFGFVILYCFKSTFFHPKVAQDGKKKKKLKSNFPNFVQECPSVNVCFSKNVTIYSRKSWGLRGVGQGEKNYCHQEENFLG